LSEKKGGRVGHPANFYLSRLGGAKKTKTGGTMIEESFRKEIRREAGGKPTAYPGIHQSTTISSEFKIKKKENVRPK